MPRDITVLFVDDDPAMRDITAELLEKVHPAITVQTEPTPSVALDLVSQEATDCVISDYNMPGIDGVELCRLVRQDHPNVPFFLFTSSNDPDVIEEALASGVTDYIQKSPGIEHYRVLANRIENAVDHHRLRTRLIASET